MPRNRITHYSYKTPVNSALPFENFNHNEIFNFYKIVEYLDFEELILYELESTEMAFYYTIGEESYSNWVSMVTNDGMQNIIGVYLLISILLAKGFIQKYWKLKSSAGSPAEEVGWRL